jgi:hypothetical protein
MFSNQISFFPDPLNASIILDQSDQLAQRIKLFNPGYEDTRLTKP